MRTLLPLILVLSILTFGYYMGQREECPEAEVIVEYIVYVDGVRIN
jgi:hypothetical protein